MSITRTIFYSSMSNLLSRCNCMFIWCCIFASSKVDGVIAFFCIFCSIFFTNYYEDWNMYTQLTSCIGISSRAICLSMQIVTLRLEILAWLEQHLRQTSWPNMLLLGGIEHLSCSSTVQNTLLQLIYGLLAAFLVKLWQENLYSLAEIMFINSGLLLRYLFP